MVIAKIITKSGMKISIEGSSEELAELLSDIERRERRFEERKEYLDRMRDRHMKRREERNTLVHGNKDLKLTDVLEEFIKNDFFDKGRPIREIMMNLEREGISAPSSTIHPLLARLVTKKKLNRERGDSGNWEYKKVK